MPAIVYEADWVVPVEGEPLRGGGVAVEGDRIVAVGPAAELEGERRRFDEAVIVPAFVNAHSHLEYAVYAGFGDTLSFAPWIALHIQRKARLLDSDAVAIARLGAAECLRSGIGTLADASFTGAAAPACDELGLRALVALEVFGADPDAALERFEALRETIAASLSDRVRLGVSPHAPYSVTADVYAACAGLGLPVVTHLAESEREEEWLLHGTGLMADAPGVPVAPAARPACLSQNAACSDRTSSRALRPCGGRRDRASRRARRRRAHCPRSNAILGCGAARSPRCALRASASASERTARPRAVVDLFEEMRTAVYTARVRERRADALTANAALELATLGSARALGLDTETGSLAPGKRADLTVVSLAGSPFLPWEEPTTAVVFGGSPDRVTLTLVDGEVRYGEGGFEWHDLRRNASAARGRLLSEAPPAPKI